MSKAELPTHIAIIMDGNGRWAKKRGLPRFAGHIQGARVFKRIANYAADIGIKVLTVYAFSTENWNRPPEEVDKLMGLMGDYLDNAEQELAGRKVRIKIIGERSALSPVLQRKILELEEKTALYTGLRLNIAINYGGRAELVRAFNDMRSEGIEVATEDLISEHLYTKDCPDPDIIIRPSGEQRISNFLLYQAAYSEFWYSDVLWPDFTPNHLDSAISDYQNRERRYGRV